MNALPVASRGMLVCVMIVVAAVVAIGLAPEHAATLVSIGIIEGLFLLLWLGAAFGIGDRVLLRALPESDGFFACIVRIAIGLGVLSLLALMLGASGLLNQVTAIGMMLVGIGLSVHHVANRRESLIAWLRTPAAAAWFTAPAGILLGVLLVGASCLPGLLWGMDDPSGYDVVAYHLQMPREWYELGRVTTLHHNVFSFMPLNVEMHYLLAMHLRGGVFEGMYLAQLMHAAFIGLTVASVGAIASRAGTLAASVGVLACATLPWMFMLGSVAYNEGGLMLYATLATACALRGKWALAGALAGLAAGCKLTGVTSAILLTPIAAGVVALTSRQFKVFAWRAPAGFALLALLAVSPWLIRTAIATSGNPIFPLAAGTLGQGHFDAGQVERFRIAHAPTADQQSIDRRLAALWKQVGSDFHYGSISIGEYAIPLAIGIALIGACFAWRDRQVIAWLIMIGGNVVVWLSATHLQGRFLTQAIPCAATLVALASTRRTVAMTVLPLLVIVATFSWQRPMTTLAGERGAIAAIGLPDPSPLQALWPTDVARAVYETDRMIVLVGDAKAFWYAIPQARLRYRSVFDVPSDRPFADAWLGNDVSDDAIVIVDPSELARFERTYRHLPSMPAAWRAVGEPFILTVDDFRKAGL